MAAWCYNRRKANRWVTDRERETAETALLVTRALELGRDDAVALFTAGHALAYVVGEFEEGAAFIDQALALNPNLAGAWTLSGWARLWLGELDLVIEHQAHAMRLSPRDPQIFIMQCATSLAHLLAGRYDEASAWAKVAMREQPNYIASFASCAASYAFAGRLDDAQRAMARVRQLDPSLRVSNLKDWVTFRRSEHFARLAEGLRMAGLPE